MSEQPQDPTGNMNVTSLDTVLGEWNNRWTERDQLAAETFTDLKAALQAREDNMKDILLLAGVQFGLMGFITAEVLAQVGLGTPPTDEERQLIRDSYINGMNELMRQQGLGPDQV